MKANINTVKDRNKICYRKKYLLMQTITNIVTCM